MMTTTTKNITTNEGTLLVEFDGIRLEYSAARDERVADAIDGKLLCHSEEYADDIARTMNAWGVTEARALGCAVVFWS